jgi:hypothetical protein
MNTSKNCDETCRDETCRDETCRDETCRDETCRRRGINIERDWQGNVLTAQEIYDREARNRARYQARMIICNARKTVKLMQDERKEKMKILKANPMTWFERPYLDGRYTTLRTIMLSRRAFVNISDDQVQALLPAYAVWLGVQKKYDKITSWDNRWKLMNCFVDDLQQSHI